MKKKVKPKTGKCVGCGKPILENSVRCRSCASKYRMSQVDMSGDKNPNWDGGKTIAYCADCGKRISKYHKRCKSCARKNEHHPNWQGGKSRPVCIDCGKRILQGNTRCLACWHKFNSGENNAAWKGGPKHCINCGVELKRSKPGSSRERCQKCHLKYAIQENHPNWKGGITPTYKLIRNLPKYDEWRQFIFKRDKYICQNCGQKGGDLHAHHIIHFVEIMNDFFEKHCLESTKEIIEKVIKYDPLWDLNNGQTLCVSCHNKKHMRQ